MFRRGFALKVVVVVLTAVMLSSWARAAADGRSAKYVFLFIGDGMAGAQVAAAEYYLGSKAGGAPSIGRLCFTRFETVGLCSTHSADAWITDSAAAATALACGVKTKNRALGIDAQGGKPQNLCEAARALGMKTGLVTTVTLNNATPAGFYARAASRADGYAIALQMADSGVDFFGGGGVVDARGKDGNQPCAIEKMRQAGYQIAVSREDAAALKPGVKAYLKTEDGVMPYDMDRSDAQMSLAEITAKGVALLDNPKGFFLMVEGGRIDEACHANDAAAAIKDVLALDLAVAVAKKFLDAHPGETLIVVTGDHETGGLALCGASVVASAQRLDAQKGSVSAFLPKVNDLKAANASFDEMLPAARGFFGFDTLTPAETEELQAAWESSLAGRRQGGTAHRAAYGSGQPLLVTCARMASRRAGLSWTTLNHSAAPVPVYATGAGGEMFGGCYDNTDICHKLKAAMGANARGFPSARE
ncbi:MAG TPA: alkaline phosphatase [Candidatus Brocadiia bacterium]|nr:alkaline phosphatase [Candidatus Brocadiia bacterium]